MLIIFAASRLRPELGVNGRAWFLLAGRLRGYPDVGGLVVGLGVGGAGAELAGWLEEGAAEVVQVALAVAGGGEAAPAAGGAVQDGPDQGEAAGFAGEPADD